MPDRTFRAGAAMADITPDRPLPNYNAQPIAPDPGVSPLRSHAVVYDDGETTGAFLSCDMTAIDRALLLTLRDACGRAAGIPPNHITVAATHTHAAPAPCPSFLSGSLPDPVYIDFFVSRTVQAVVAAKGNLRPARIVSGAPATPGTEYNRRLLRPNGLSVMSGATNSDPTFPPAGPVDPEMPFLAFEDLSGNPIALVMNYPCHNNCVGAVFHGDLGGCAGDAIREMLGANIPTPFTEAPCGDVIWRGPRGVDIRGDALARRIGASIAEPLVAAYRQASRVDVDRVTIRTEVLDIPDRSADDSTFCHDDCRGDGEKPRAFARKRYDPEEAAIRARGPTSCPVEIQGISFGDTALVTNPAELFVAYGIEIRRRSPFQVTLVPELTNGYCGYVPTEKAFEEQGYETPRSLYTSRLVRDGGRRITEAAVARPERLMDDRRSVSAS